MRRFQWPSSCSPRIVCLFALIPRNRHTDQQLLLRPLHIQLLARYRLVVEANPLFSACLRIYVFRVCNEKALPGSCMHVCIQSDVVVVV